MDNEKSMERRINWIQGVAATLVIMVVAGVIQYRDITNEHRMILTNHRETLDKLKIDLDVGRELNQQILIKLITIEGKISHIEYTQSVIEASVRDLSNQRGLKNLAVPHTPSDSIGSGDRELTFR